MVVARSPGTPVGLAIRAPCPARPAGLLHACARIEPAVDFRVLVLGDGEDRPAMEELAASTATRFGRVVFAGDQAHHTPDHRAIDVLAIRSESEQMPVALVEASALPVASTDVGDVRARLPEIQAAHVVPIAAHETAWPLAECPTAHLRDAEERARPGAANRERALERSGFEKMLTTYRAVYREALGRR